MLIQSGFFIPCRCKNFHLLAIHANFPLNISYKYHTIIALVISLWLVLFLVLIAPFYIAEPKFSVRLEILPIYGIVSFVVYMSLIPIQNWTFKQFEK